MAIYTTLLNGSIKPGEYMATFRKATTRANIAFCICFLTVSFAFSGETAKILKISGKAEILQTETWSEAKVNQMLDPGQAVRLVGGGEVALEAANGNIRVTIKDNTTLEYDGLTNSGVAPWQSSRQAKTRQAPNLSNGVMQQFACPVGNVEFNVTTGNPLRVVAPLMSASVRGTGFSMLVTGDGSSTLDVSEGSVESFDRMGSRSMLGAGQFSSLNSGVFTAYLDTHNISSPTGDWRDISETVLDNLDAENFNAPQSQRIYSPVTGQVYLVDHEGDIDVQRVTQAIYLEGRSLEDLLDDPDAHPMAPQWLESLEQNPLTGQELLLALAYMPETENGQNFASGGPAGAFSGWNMPNNSLSDGTSPGQGIQGLTADNLPAARLVSGFLSNTPDWTSTTGAEYIATGAFGFDLNLQTGYATNGFVKGETYHASTPNYRNVFDVSGGTGQFTDFTGIISGMTGTHVEVNTSSVTTTDVYDIFDYRIHGSFPGGYDNGFQGELFIHDRITGLHWGTPEAKLTER